MKRNSGTKLAALVGALCATAISPLLAQTPSRWYVGADLGLNLLNDVTLHGVTISGPVVSRFALQMDFDPGPRLDLNVGYHLTDSWAVELETGASYNSVSQATLTSGGVPSDTGTEFYQVPILANIKYSHPLSDKWSFYVGAGIGGVFTHFDSGITLPGYSGFDSPDWRPGSDTDFQFAYQGTAGIKYVSSQHWDFGIGYKFLGSTDHEWTINSRTGTSDATYAHSILVTVSYHF